MRKLLLLLSSVVLAAACTGQPDKTVSSETADNSDASLYVNDFSRPIVDVLKDVSDFFGVPVTTKNIPEDMMVDFADVRLHPHSLEATLKDIASASEITVLHRSKKNEYSLYIDNRYCQWEPEEGAAFLDYLSSLYPDKASWEARRDSLRKEFRYNLGLQKYPEHFSGEVFISDKREYDGYYVQNIGLEILPGVYCTGSVYHPSAEGKFPVVLNPHGHFDHGRYNENNQIRCAMQARMGCIAVSYDMFAYGEQPMFDPKYHRTGLAQPMNVLSGLRLLDYMLSREDADASRVCVTGASGGGSQTMFLGALDDRITILAPVVMMSSFFIGGCQCESGTKVFLSGTRTNNVEIASIFAPKPMLIVSDGHDWTRTTPEVEYPFVKRLYGYYGAEDKVFNVHLANDVHDYGPNKRQAVYAFIAEQFALPVEGFLDADGLFDESKCVVEELDLLKVWGPEGENWPKNAITDIAELAKVLKFEKNR